MVNERGNWRIEAKIDGLRRVNVRMIVHIMEGFGNRWIDV